MGVVGTSVFSTTSNAAFQTNPVDSARETVANASQNDTSATNSQSSLSSPSTIVSISDEATAAAAQGGSTALFSNVNSPNTTLQNTNGETSQTAETENEATSETTTDGSETAETSENETTEPVDPATTINNILEDARDIISNFRKARERLDANGERDRERSLSPVQRAQAERGRESVTDRNRGVTESQRQQLVNIALRSQAQGTGQLNTLLANNFLSRQE